MLRLYANVLFYIRLGHLWILVSFGVLEPMPHKYKGVTVFILPHTWKRIFLSIPVHHFINEVAFSPVNLQSTPAHTSPLTSSRWGFAEPPFSVLLPGSQPAIQCPQCPNPSSLLHGIFQSCPCVLPLHPLTHCMQGLSHTIPCIRPDTVRAALSASIVGKDRLLLKLQAWGRRQDEGKRWPQRDQCSLSTDLRESWGQREALLLIIESQQNLSLNVFPR